MKEIHVFETLLTAKSETLVPSEAATDQMSPPAGALISAVLVVRLLILAALLVGELFHFGLPVLPTLSPTLKGWWWPMIWNARSIVEAALGGVIATIFFSWQEFLPEVRVAVRKTSSGHIRWLIAHIICALAVLVWLTLGRFDFSPVSGTLWFIAGVGLFVASLT